MNNQLARYSQPNRSQPGPYIQITCAVRTDHMWVIPLFVGRQVYSCPECYGKTTVRIYNDLTIETWGEESYKTHEVDKLRFRQKQIKLSEFIDEYFRYSRGYKKETTLRNESNYTRKFLGYIGDKFLREIEIRDLDKWKSEMFSELSATTFNIERRALQAIFNIAVKWGYLDKNPFKEVTKKKVEERRLFLTDEELHSVFEKIEEDIKKARSVRKGKYLIKFKLFLEFLLNTGLRRQEAISLQKENLNLEKNVIYVEKTKSKSLRIIPVNKKAKEILESLDDTLFNTLLGSSISHKFSHYLKRAKLEGFHVHSLRHTFATRLISLGVDLYTVSLLLGHSDIRTSMRYAKANVNVLQDAVKKLDGCDNLVTDFSVGENIAEYELN